MAGTPDHPVAQFATSGMFYMIEDIRKDSESDNYYIYGYVRGTEGEFVQVGILADTVMALTERFSPQTLMEELAAGEQIVYALVVDKDLSLLPTAMESRWAFPGTVEKRSLQQRVSGLPERRSTKQRA